MLDEIDLKIITELQADGRLSYADLARKLQINNSTALRRIKKLLEDGVITVHAVTDPKKVGLPVMAFIALNVEQSRIDDICNFLSTSPSIYFIATSFGRYDILITIQSPSTDALSQFIKEKITTTPGVLKAETFYLSNITKRTLGAPPQYI